MSGTSCGAENSWAARSASWAICARRALQRPQPAKCSMTRSGTATGSSSSRRSTPSEICLTVHLLSKRRLRPSDQSPHVSNLHPERLGNFHIAHAAVTHHQNRGRAARQSTQNQAYVRPSFPLDDRLLDTRRRSHDLHQELALVAAPLSPK